MAEPTQMIMTIAKKIMPLQRLYCVIPLELIYSLRLRLLRRSASDTGLYSLSLLVDDPLTSSSNSVVFFSFILVISSNGSFIYLIFIKIIDLEIQQT